MLKYTVLNEGGNILTKYKKQCGSCVHYRIDDLRGGDRDGYGCDANGKAFGSSYYKRFPFDHTCSRYKEDSNRSDRDIEKAYKALDSKYGYRPGSSSWWHIATFVNETLGNNLCGNYFYIMVDFRENYLQKNLKYVNFLIQYDIYGRLIVDSLRKDHQKTLIARELLLNHIIPICQAIEAQQYDEAFGKYCEMFETLKNLYQINEVSTYNFDNPKELSNTEILSLKRQKEEN